MKTMINNILSDMQASFRSYIFAALSACFLAFVVSIALLIIRAKYKNNIPKLTFLKIKRYLFSIAMVGCAVMMLYETILSRPAGSRQPLRLIFYFENIFKDPSSGKYLYENFILFLPFGFIASGIFQKKNRFFKTFAASFLTSLCIETLQLITSRGYFQLSDLLTNTLGGMAGAAVYIILAAILT